ncbi:MAG: sugar phosphate isomerase/epimerase family protein, partial [Chloroflexota bacterium]
MLGLSTSMLLDRPLLTALDFMAAEGFRNIELWADFPHAHPDDMTPEARSELRHKLAGRGRLSLHAPLGGTNLSSVNPGIWRESLRQHRMAVELASELEAEALVVHTGELRDARLVETARERCLTALRELVELARPLGVHIALENTGPYLMGLDRTTAEFIALLDSVGPDLRVCFDNGHARLNGNDEEIVRLLGPRISNLHLHDNHGAHDDHLPIGQG